jgi:hypothetical protein
VQSVADVFGQDLRPGLSFADRELATVVEVLVQKP